MTSSPRRAQDVVVGGQITLFTKQECPYCLDVKQQLECMASRVLADHPTGKLEWKIIDCDSPPSNVALCARLTGQLSVPHVFFNSEYIGNHDITVSLCGRAGNGDQNLIYKKLVTSQVGHASSQPNEHQLSKQISALGFNSVVNLSSVIEVPDEARLVTSAGMQYLHFPLASRDALPGLVDQVDKLLAPTLVYGPGSVLACLVLARVTDPTDQERLAKLYFGVDDLTLPNTDTLPLAKRAKPCSCGE
ncbi:hypothetical protein BASA81_004514 [Batrachochytrium salamandrivorans]|nr:hypothetical protein BASA81_004514 [Batrachochytrium salamandrivorans]